MIKKFKLSVSNIGWTADKDEAVYSLMKKYRYSGLEIAPTRIFPETPYDHLTDAKNWGIWLKEQYGFEVSSMQSIWFGRTEKLFGTEEERTFLIDYTKRAIDFAAAVKCRNLVFGCPKNRFIPEKTNRKIGVRFFKIIGDYAAGRGIIVGMEANPPVYHTNYVNDTASALKLIEAVHSAGFALNLDVGTMLLNGESAESLRGKVDFISHVHISEPELHVIEKRDIHRQLRDILSKENYQGYISIEMGKTRDLRDIESTLEYVKEIFG